MKLKKYIYIAIISMTCFCAHAQKEGNWWYFGRNLGLNFNDLSTVNSSAKVPVPNMPRAVKGPVDALESSCTLSDKNGNLLMSSDGITVYNKNNQIMDGGTGLLGGSSTTQPVVFCPFPGSPDKYYIITIASERGLVNIPSFGNGIRYSVVDFSANNGLGKIIEKNTLMDNTAISGDGITPVSLKNSDENMAVVRSTDKSTFWLVHRKTDNFTATIFVWSVTAAGLNPTAKSYTFPLQYKYANSDSFSGYLKFSVDGKRFVSPQMGDGIMSGFFDPATGVPNGLKNSVGDGVAYSAEFSLSGNMVYIGTGQALYAATSAQISWDDLRKGTIMPTVMVDLGYPTGMQLVADGRLFLRQGLRRGLVVIMEPEKAGVACNAQYFDNYLVDNSDKPENGYSGSFGFPSFPSYYASPYVVDMKDFTSCAGGDFKFALDIDPSTGATIDWDFGDGTTVVSQALVAGTTSYAQKHKYATEGSFVIKITVRKTDKSVVSVDNYATVNATDCVIKTNKMIRIDLPNTAELKFNR